MKRITIAEWDIILGHFEAFRKRLAWNRGKELRLLVNMLDLTGSYNLPTDVADALDDAITGTYNASVKGQTLPSYNLQVIFTAFDGFPIVDCLASTLIAVG